MADVATARTHAYLILMLELILQHHRNKYATPFENLPGATALHHNIFLKTKWYPKTIKELDYEDCLLVCSGILNLAT
ncbi:ECs1072 family phage-associated protein [Symbiopectobacterium purcellii]|uniref:ECs1072 family phage-associated protein n=1 Tax=Symbiopectobacterium purcellii TaxID=2871826 RepID=UPI003F872C59